MGIVGQCGVAVLLGDGWLLHCGDSFYATVELEKAPAMVRFFVHVAHEDPRQAREQLDRIRRLLVRADGSVTVMASHDRQGFDRLAGD